MKTFSITINGVNYIAEVEEITGGAASASVAQPVSQAAPAATPAPKAPARARETAGAISVKAPMPGNILKVNCKVGAAVKKGDVIMVLEAMKMENDICAPQDGVVASIDVAQGSSVETDSILATLS